jgi:hypothetical protein
MQLNDGNEKPTPYVLAHKEGNKIHITLLYDEDSSHFIDLDYAAFKQLNSGAARVALREAALRLQRWAESQAIKPPSMWDTYGTAVSNTPNRFGDVIVNKDDLRPPGSGVSP